MSKPSPVAVVWKTHHAARCDGCGVRTGGERYARLSRVDRVGRTEIRRVCKDCYPAVAAKWCVEGVSQ